MEKLKQDLQNTHKKYQATAEDLERTTKRLVTALDIVYNRPGILFWRGFIRGVGQGLGATIGAALVLLLLSWLLRQLGGIPALSDWVNDVNRSLPINN